MKKTVVKELILPAFWAFLFIFPSKKEKSTDEIKTPSTVIKQEATLGGAIIPIKYKEASVTKPIYIAAY